MFRRNHRRDYQIDQLIGTADRALQLLVLYLSTKITAGGSENSDIASAIANLLTTQEPRQPPPEK